MKTKQTVFAYVVTLATALFILATTSSPAADQVPFNGIDLGHVISSTPIDDCHVLFEGVNEGNANQLGRFTGPAQVLLNVCDLSYVGSFVFTAANGDSISASFTGYLTPTAIPGVFDNHESGFITSGTGRFSNATGEMTFGGQFDTNNGTFSLPWHGTISSVGSTR